MATGTLFTEDFLAEGIAESAAWQELGDDQVGTAVERIRAIFDAVPNPSGLNEAQTQHRIIEPILAELGWTGALDVQTNLERRGRAHVPDYSFFATPEAFAASQHADGFDGRVRHAVAIGDAKAGLAFHRRLAARTWPPSQRKIVLSGQLKRRPDVILCGICVCGMNMTEAQSSL